MMRSAWLLSVVFILLAGPLWADSRQDTFSLAREAYKARNQTALEQYARQLQADGYPLAPYVEYWRALLRLDDAGNDEMRELLARYADIPFAARLRAEWLKKLGQRADWTTFFEEFPRLAVEDTAVACYALQGRIERGESAALQEGKAVWMSPQDRPANCDAVFDAMQSAGVLGKEDIWLRFRLALQEGKLSVAKAILRRLPEVNPQSAGKLLDQASQNPQQGLQKKRFNTSSRLGRELNLYALERVTRSQPDLALSHWNALRSRFGEEEQGYLWGRMALHAARRHDPRALEWYGLAGAAPLSREQLEWKARCALRVRDWNTLQATVAAMAPPQAEELAWRYWNARAFKEQGQIPAANAIFVLLARERSYYGLLAGEELGDSMLAPHAQYKAAEAEIRAVENLPGIQRAIELDRVDMRWESKNEWAWATRDFNDQQLIAAAELAFRQDWYDIAITTAEKTTLTHDFSLRYPTPYRDRLQRYANENALDEAWVYGLIRQESRFISHARSSAGASGLMQVMPATAKWIAKRIGLGDYHHGMIHQLDTNLQFGTHYMRYVLDQMDGQALMATAAYNAGPGRPRRWAAAQPLEGAIYAETIPFTETREYVKKVMGNAYFYAQQLGLRMQGVKQRLGIVNGKELQDNPPADAAESQP